MEENSTVSVPLDKGQFAFVSASQYHLVKDIKWHARWTDRARVYYACACVQDNRPDRSGKRRHILMHRLLCGILDDRSMVVHHIDGNGLNNTESNLLTMSPFEHDSLPEQHRSRPRIAPHIEVGYVPPFKRMSVVELATAFMESWPDGIPIGRCWCGCGEKTRIVRSTDTRRFRFRGFPTPYVFGHQGKGKPSRRRGIPVVNPNIHPFKFLDGSPKFIIDDVAGCWNWVGGVDSGGYGETTYAHLKRGRAHVVSWEYHNKQNVPKGMVVDHICGNRKCCNPLHLQVKTQRDNARAGRNTKLSQSDVDYIRFLYLSRQKKMEEIAKAYEVHESHISRVVSGKTWCGLAAATECIEKPTRHERGLSRRLNSNNTSGFKGVIQCKNRDKLLDRWIYRIQTAAVREQSRRYNSPEAAAHGWDSRMRELFGDRVLFNFPDPITQLPPQIK